MPRLPIWKIANWARISALGVSDFGKIDEADDKIVAEFMVVEIYQTITDYFALTKIEQGCVHYPFGIYPDPDSGATTVTNDPMFASGATQCNVAAMPAACPPTGIIAVGGELCYYYGKGALAFNILAAGANSGRNYPNGGPGSDHLLGAPVTYVRPFNCLVGTNEFGISPPGSKTSGIFMPIVLRYLADRFIKKTKVQKKGL
jgi:hypothetical protein